MLATNVACPSCSTPLRSSKQPLFVGRRVRCPRCNLTFTIGDPMPAADTNVQPPAPMTFVQPPHTFPSAAPAIPPGFSAPEPDEEEAPANRGLILAAIVGGLLLLVGASVGLAFLFSGPGGKSGGQASPDKKDESQASTDRKSSDNPRAERDRTRAEVNKNDGRPRPIEEPINLTTLPAEEQEKVNKAVEKGVAHLKQTQLASGSWKNNGYHPLGCAALPGLTLLECGVKPEDPVVQKAATYVRDHALSNMQTYEISLAVLFLDRLGEAGDRDLIRKLGLRLVAGQSAGGGWSYTCPTLNDTRSRDLQLALEKTRPQTSRELHFEIHGTGAKPEITPAGKAEFTKAVDNLPTDLKQIPALRPPSDLPAEMPAVDYPAHDRSRLTDNSNTQFGLLGVWVAGRHGVPTERSLALVARRFHANQSKSGGWVYYSSKGPAAGYTPSMTAAGLLGLAVGHGLSGETDKNDPKRKKVEDPAIEKGLKLLAQSVGKPLGSDPRQRNKRTLSSVNLYLLWSIERVAMLYNLKTLDGKDWYAWGAEMIVDAQRGDGSWNVGAYPGVNATHTPLVDTCFALLFLKRANLVKDLTNKVEFVLDAK